MFTPLKIVTDYSILKSTIRIDELIIFLKENNITCCSICDENLYGAIEFYTKMKENNLKPIIGLEINIDNYVIYLYAKNLEGYKNLLKIHTLKEKKELTFKSLKGYLKEIKIVLPCSSYDLLKDFENAYLGYTTDTEKNVALMKTEKVVYYKNVRALTESDTKYLSYLEAYDKNVSFKEVSTDYSSNYLTLDINEEDKKTTIDFVSDIEITLDYNNKIYIPKYDKEKNSEEYLTSLANKGLKERLNNKILVSYQRRLDYELSVIKKMGLADYFLIIYDCVLYTKRNNIRIKFDSPMTGSLVNYCLGITDIDPIDYSMSFESLLNPQKTIIPFFKGYIDLYKEEEISNYIKERYGKYNVARVIVYGNFGTTAVVRRIGEMFNLSTAKIDEFTGMLDPYLSLEENLELETIKKFIKNNKKLKEICKICLKLLNLKMYDATRAKFLIVSNVPLDEIIPIHIDSVGNIIAGVTLDYIKDFGLLKIEMIGLLSLAKDEKVLIIEN